MILRSSEQTRNYAKTFAKKIENGGVVCLIGDLGAGKTTFTQGLALGLGIEKSIISPTFIIIRKYAIPRLRNEPNFLYHIDLYRTDTQMDIKELGIPELFANSKNIVVIEWAEKLEKLLPRKRWEIRFKYLSENMREIKLIQVS